MRTDRETGVFVRRADKFLLLHRTVDRYWHIVAGVVEEGESYAEAAARELREEVGLDVPIVDLGLPQGYAIPPELQSEYAAGITEVAIQSFLAEAAPGWEPVLNEEHDDYRWCGLSDAIALAHWPETVDAFVALGSRRIPG